MRTQREFITETVKQTLQLKNAMKLGNLIDIVYKNVETNVKLSDVKDYLPYALEFKTENIKTGAVPGSPAMINNISFFEYSKSQTQKLIDELFTAEESTSDSSSSTTSKDSSTTTKIATSEAAKVKIELLNGSGNSKTLTDVTNILKKKGYNVYKTGTTSTSSKTSVVVNNEVKEDILTNILELLDTGTVTKSATSSQSKTDITIILGKDYK